MENKNKKELTLADLANLITETRTSLEEKISMVETSLEKKIDSKINFAIEEIATKTQNEFLKINERFDGVDKRFDEVNSKIDNIELTVNNKRVDIFTHKDLEHRVEKLEDNWKKYKPMITKTAKC